MKNKLIIALSCLSFSVFTTISLCSFFGSSDVVSETRAIDDVSKYDFDFYDYDVNPNSTYYFNATYDSNYIYKNPTYYEVINVFNSYVSVDSEVAIDINTFRYDGVDFGLMLLNRSSNQFRIGLMTSSWSNYHTLMTWNYDGNNVNGYVYIDNPNLFVSLFNGTHSYTIRYSYDNQLQFYKFLTYYYSNVSIRNFTAFMNQDISKDIQSVFADRTAYNGALFFSSQLYDIYNNSDEWDSALLYTIFEGGFYSNGQYFDSIRVDFYSAYSGTTDSLKFVQGQDIENIVMNNTSLKGYFFINSIRYVNHLSGNAISVYEVDGYLTPLIGYTYVFDSNSPRWTNSAYQTIDLFYVSHIRHHSSDLTALNNLSYANTLTLFSTLVPQQSVDIVSPTSTTLFTQVFSFLTIAFVGLTPFLTWEILPGFSIGVLFLVPLVITLLLFVLKLFKR